MNDGKDSYIGVRQPECIFPFKLVKQSEMQKFQSSIQHYQDVAFQASFAIWPALYIYSNTEVHFFMKWNSRKFCLLTRKPDKSAKCSLTDSRS